MFSMDFTRFSHAGLRILATVSLAFLTACAGNGMFGEQEKITPESLLEKAGDVPFEGVDASLLKSAKKATEEGNHRKAAQFYKQIISEAPEKDLYQLAYAESLRRSGDYGMALNTYEAFLRKHPDSLIAHEGRGLTLLAQGEIEPALEALDAVRKRDGKRWRTLNAIGVGLSIQKKNEDALRYFREALSHSEHTPSILNNIGLTLAVMDDYPRAIKALQMASDAHKGAEAEKKHIDLNLALVHGLAGDMDDAERIASKYLEKAELYNNLGYYAYLANEKDLAKTYLNMALTQSPEHYKKAWDNLQQVMKK